jgi:hypothetical protein
MAEEVPCSIRLLAQDPNAQAAATIACPAPASYDYVIRRSHANGMPLDMPEEVRLAVCKTHAEMLKSQGKEVVARRTQA